jgi:putative membrane protein
MIDYDGKRWLDLLARMRGSVVPRVLTRVGATAVLGGAALLAKQHAGFSVSAFAHTLVGAALGLLLVFRTNSDYDRFWEGRKLLGLLVNRARDLMRQAASYIDGEAAPGDRDELRRLVGLFYGLVRQGLRGERDLSPLASLLGPGEAAVLEPVASRPAVAMTWISQRLGALASEGRLTEQRLMLMDANLTAFSDGWGGAERILRTPVPFAYAHHIKLFLSLFVFTVPFAMVDAMGILTPVAAAALAFALFGIDEIGVEIEDPFGYDPNDLPLDAIGETIVRDVSTLAELGAVDRPALTARRPRDAAGASE